MSNASDGGRSLSVVVCTYNRHSQLNGTVASLLYQENADLEIIIIDNSPNLEAANKAKDAYAAEKNVRYFLEPIPGLSRARNIGAAKSTHGIVAYIDDDAVAAPRWALEIANSFEASSLVGAVGGLVSPRWMSPKPEWLTPKLLNYLSILDLGPETRELKAGEWLVGCNIAFRKNMLEASGGFSEALGRIGSAALLSNEEQQVVNRIQQNGGLIIYNPNARVEHLIDPERLSEQWFYRRAAWQAVSNYLSNAPEAQRRASKAAERVARFLDKNNPPENSEARIAFAHNIVLACLDGQTLFENKQTSRRSRLSQNILAIPGKIAKRLTTTR